MNKSDKELAVDVAIAYIHAAGQQHDATGNSKGIYDLAQIEKVITHVYNTLGKLDDESK